MAFALKNLDNEFVLRKDHYERSNKVWDLGTLQLVLLAHIKCRHFDSAQAAAYELMRSPDFWKKVLDRDEGTILPQSLVLRLSVARDALQRKWSSQATPPIARQCPFKGMRGFAQDAKDCTKAWSENDKR